MPWLSIVSVAAAAFAAVGGGLWWPRRTVALAAGAALVSIAHTAIFRGPGSNAVAYWLVAETGFMLVVLAQAVRRQSPPLSAAGTILTFAAIALSPLRIGLWQSPPAPIIQILTVCAAWALPAAAAAGVGGYLRWTDRAREQAAIVARREQRIQLARDLHDWLSHEMTGIVLEAQAGQLGARGNAETAQSFERIEDAGVRGLEAMDRALRLLRDPGEVVGTERLATVAEVEAVARRFSERTAARVDVSIDDGLDTLRPEVVATVHRVVMESLTNIRRHAATATMVQVRIAREGSDLVVAVVDDGRASGRLESRLARRNRHGGGVGLAGLADQVAALDGRLQAGRRTDGVGWTVRAVLPVSP